jgi:tRNA threonylcarbamoyladenosine biosynthesis protein TsaE
MIEKTFSTHRVAATVELGRRFGKNLKGGEVLEFVSDLGGGKTTFIRGLAEGFGSTDPVASPSFTISYTYSRADGKRLHHFDFYRLDEAGIVGTELAEFLGDPQSVVAVEWGEIVHDVLPSKRIKITIAAPSETARDITIAAPKDQSYILEGVNGA